MQASDLQVKHNVSTRSEVDPPVKIKVRKQSIGVVAYELFDTPRILATGGKLYGLFKVRGVFEDESDAEGHINTLITKHDDKHINYMYEIGKWYPITTDRKFIQLKEIQDGTGSVKVNTASAELDRHRLEEMRKKEAKQLEEIKERERELKERVFDENQDTLDAYTLCRNTEMLQQQTIDDNEKQLIKLKEKHMEWVKRCRKIEALHPEYKDQWVVNLNKERIKAGMIPYVLSEADVKRYEGLLA